MWSNLSGSLCETEADSVVIILILVILPSFKHFELIIQLSNIIQ